MTKILGAPADVTRARTLVRELFSGATAKAAMIAAGYSVQTARKSAKRTLRGRSTQMAMLEFLEWGELDLDGLSPREALRRVDLILAILC
jgi:hypothetical protein